MTRPSDVNEGINQALEVAPQGEKGAHRESEILSPSGAEGLGFRPVSERGNGIPAKPILNRATESLLGLEEVASPESSTAQAGNTGMSTSARVDVPEVPLESLAKYSDEGENGWNAWGRADIAKKMQRIAAGGYNSVEKLIDRVEELVEVGR